LATLYTQSLLASALPADRKIRTGGIKAADPAAAIGEDY
jgi:hypothetical protein